MPVLEIKDNHSHSNSREIKTSTKKVVVEAEVTIKKAAVPILTVIAVGQEMRHKMAIKSQEVAVSNIK